jgi:hypothetical protein
MTAVDFDRFMLLVVISVAIMQPINNVRFLIQN